MHCSSLVYKLGELDRTCPRSEPTGDHFSVGSSPLLSDVNGLTDQIFNLSTEKSNRDKLDLFYFSEINQQEMRLLGGHC